MNLAQFKQSKNSLESKSKVDKYLAKNYKEDDGKFDILSWWKVNSIIYHILSDIALNVFAIRISTVTFEFTFSTIDPLIHFKIVYLRLW